MIFITFLTALALSGVAAYYSVIGLAAIFPGSFWPIVIMGSVLEGAKLVTVSWLYRNWKVAHIGMKSYLTVATVILMLITSMGIFGYLSKAHLEHSADTAPLAMKVQLLDEKIRVAKENISEDRKALKQMDEAVDQVMGRSTDEKGADKAIAVRKQQAKERTRLLSDIETQQKTITEYSTERSPLYVELSKAESDFGPLKYVAELIYGSGEADIIDRAVRLVIMLIMAVFDPLAVLLLIAANISMTENKTPKGHKNWNDLMKGQPTELVKEPESVETKEPEVDRFAYLKQPFKHFENLKPMVAEKEPKYEQDEGPLSEEQIEQLAPNVETRTVEIPEDNLIVIDEIGNTIPPIATKYDYDAAYSFREKGK